MAEDRTRAGHAHDWVTLEDLTHLNDRGDRERLVRSGCACGSYWLRVSHAGALVFEVTMVVHVNRLPPKTSIGPLPMCFASADVFAEHWRKRVAPSLAREGPTDG